VSFSACASIARSAAASSTERRSHLSRATRSLFLRLDAESLRMGVGSIVTTVWRLDHGRDHLLLLARDMLPAEGRGHGDPPHYAQQLGALAECLDQAGTSGKVLRISARLPVACS